MNHAEHYARNNALQAAIQFHGGSTQHPETLINTAQKFFDFIGAPEEPADGGSLSGQVILQPDL